MKKRFSILFLAFVMAAVLAFAACGDSGGGGASSGGGTSSGGSGDLVEKGYQSDMQKDSIVIRGVRSITGFNGSFEETAFGPMYKMWVDKMNQDGGLYVKSLDRKVMVDVSVVDDGSDAVMTQQLFERVLVEDQPDLVLPPVSTGALKVVVPVAQQYDYLLIGGEGGARELEPFMDEYPNFYEVLGYCSTQVPAFIKLADELGIESVYIAYVDDTHGIEYTEMIREEFDKVGIPVLGADALDVTGNFDPAVVINSAKNSGADAFIINGYPPQNIPLTITAATLQYNPKAYLVGPGGGYSYFGENVFGDTSNKKLDGMMAWGAWSENSSPAAKEFSETFKAYWIDKGLFWKNADGSDNPNGNVYQDWWGQPGYATVTQILQQAVENAGELGDNGMLKQSTLVEYIKDATFDTVLNSQLRFTNNRLMDDMYLGNITQWQDGVAEVIDADARRTADPIYPKPAWPSN